MRAVIVESALIMRNRILPLLGAACLSLLPTPGLAASLSAGDLVGYVPFGTTASLVSVDPTTGQVTTLVQELPRLFSGRGVVVDANGDVIFAGQYRPSGQITPVGVIYRFDPELGSLSTITSAIADPRDLELLPGGEIVVQSGATAGPVVLDPISGAQILSLHDPSVLNSVWLGVDPTSSAVYVEQTGQHQIYRLDGGASLVLDTSAANAQFRPTDIAVNPAGLLFVGSEDLGGGPFRILRIDPVAHTWSYFTPTGMPGSVISLEWALDGALLASVYVEASGGNEIVRIDPSTRAQSVVAPGFGSAYFAVVPVPEPGAAVLLGAALVGLAILRGARNAA